MPSHNNARTVLGMRNSLELIGMITAPTDRHSVGVASGILLLVTFILVSSVTYLWLLSTGHGRGRASRSGYLFMGVAKHSCLAPANGTYLSKMLLVQTCGLTNQALFALDVPDWYHLENCMSVFPIQKSLLHAGSCSKHTYMFPGTYVLMMGI